MSRLAWRIFAAFWLVLLLTLLLTAGFNFWNTRADLEAARAATVAAGLESLANEAQRAVSADGRPGLLRWLEARQPELPAPLLVIGPDGQELLQRPVPPFIQGLVRRRAALAEQGRTAAREFARRRPRVATVAGADGPYTLVVGGFKPSRPRAGRLMTPTARRVFPLVLLVLSGGACFWLAGYLTRPIQVFRRVGQGIAAGNLEARVGPEMRARNDEFGALARDFDMMADRVAGLLATQRRLLRDVSHELRSPLARLQIAVELLRQQSDGAAAPQLERIEREAERLNSMIGQILEYSRLETASAIDAERLNLDDLLGDVVDNAAFEAGALGKQVTLSGQTGLMISAEPALLQSALDNIVRNAVQHARAEVAVNVAVTAAQVEISVADDGTGVAEPDISRIFEPFYTHAPSNSGKGTGAGIGLAIAARAANLHGGTLTAANREGGGLTVRLSLPLPQ